MLGFRFCPRLRDFPDRKVASIEPATAYPTLQPLLGRRIKVDVIREHWHEVVRLVASLKAGTVAPSAMLRKLAAYRRRNQLDLALQELGRIERTLFMLDWLEARNCADAAMPGSTRASSVISSRRSSAHSNKAGKQGRQTRPDCRPQSRGAAVSCLRPQPRHRRDRVLELHLHRRRHRPSPCD